MSFSLIPDIPYTSARDTRCRYDLYLPDGTDTYPLIIYFYGGSLKKGAKEGNRLARAAVEAGYAVAVPDYRLIPEVSYPAFIDDAADAVCAVIFRNQKVLSNCVFECDGKRIYDNGKWSPESHEVLSKLREAESAGDGDSGDSHERMRGTVQEVGRSE